MAKRLSPDEKPFRPVQEQLRRENPEFPDRELVQSVLRHAASDEPALAGQGTAPAVPPPQRPATLPSKVFEMPAPEARKPRPETKEKEEPAAAAPYEAHTEHLRFKVIRSEAADARDLVHRLGTALGTRLQLSHIMRAWLNVLRHSEREVIRALEKADLRRPANEDQLGLAAFEHDLSSVLLEALRNAPPIGQRER